MNIPVSVPDELVFNILILLPVKSLLRLRSVCKRWRCMISDPSFVEAHQSHLSATTALLILFVDMHSPRIQRTLYTLNPSTNEVEEVRGLSGFSNWNISKSVNGLVCIYEPYPAESHRVGLFNPTTREYVNLPPPIFSGRDFLTHVYSLGFDPSTNTYKIMRSTLGEWWGRKYEIFTVCSDSSWRILKDDPQAVLNTKGIYLNGTIYWIKVRRIQIDFENIVIGFDLGEEKFRYVPVPATTPIWKVDTPSMVQIGGHIAVVDYEPLGYGNVVIMWKLEDYFNEIWSHKRIVLPESFIHHGLMPRFFCVNPIDGGDIALIPSELFRDSGVVYYNLEEETTRTEVLSWLPRWPWDISSPYINYDDVSVYVPSLISLKEICRL